jgi:hypothetical protein
MCSARCHRSSTDPIALLVALVPGEEKFIELTTHWHLANKGVWICACVSVCVSVRVCTYVLFPALNRHAPSYDLALLSSALLKHSQKSSLATTSLSIGACATVFVLCVEYAVILLLLE